ncbi:MAG: hypothetical protein II949_08395 [Prevotella sp.]|nr:hypothetical protein [Prevotella sp.]
MLARGRPYTGGIACTLTLALDGPSGWHKACPYTGGIACALTLAASPVP